MAAAEKGEIFVGVAEGITNRELYQEFIVAQVKVSFSPMCPRFPNIEFGCLLFYGGFKTMSFLAYVLRTATEDIRKHAETMAGASIRLLRDCPPEAVASRKVRLPFSLLEISTSVKLTACCLGCCE